LLDALAPVAAGTEVKPDQTTPEQTAVIADLHWLVHQGHVIEFANGVLETAKKPKPRPEPKPKAEAIPGATADAPPNASVEVIEPKVAELEAAQPTSGAPQFSETEIADLKQSAEANLNDSGSTGEQQS
jgi:hypothetical protein